MEESESDYYSLFDSRGFFSACRTIRWNNHEHEVSRKGRSMIKQQPDDFLWKQDILSDAPKAFYSSSNGTGWQAGPRATLMSAHWLISMWPALTFFRSPTIGSVLMVWNICFLWYNVWVVKGRKSPLLFKTDIGLIRSLCKRSVTLSYALMISTIHHLILDVYKKNDAVVLGAFIILIALVGKLIRQILTKKYIKNTLIYGLSVIISNRLIKYNVIL